jgi:Na+-driven multidrug efflux pump
MRYLGTYLWGASLVFCFFTVDASFRASGDTRTPLGLLLVSVVAALMLDPVLILGLGPAPRLGIAGAAVSMLVTRFVTTVAGITLLSRRGLVKFGRPTWHNIASITRVGLPTALTGIVFSLVYVLLTRTTTRFGAAAAAVVGQNLGAHRVDRARRAGWIATGFVTAIGCVGASLEYFCAVPFARFFTSDPAVIAEGARYLRIGALSTLFAGAEVVLEGSLGGAGDTLPPMITSTALTVLRIPLAAWAADKWGPPGIWWVLSITALGRGVAMSALWKWRNWSARAV